MPRCIRIFRLQGWDIAEFIENPQAKQCGNQTHLQDQALPIPGPISAANEPTNT